MIRRRGVSLLLETIVGLGLFTVALLFSLGVIVGVANSSSQAREYSLALETARQVMEQVRGTPYSSILVPAAPPYLVSAPFIENGAGANLDLTVTVTTAEPVVNQQKNVLVNVTWVHGSMVRNILLESCVVNI